MFKIYPTNYRINNCENIFVLYINNKIEYCNNSLTLSHIIIDKPSLNDHHLNDLNNRPNVCLIEYKNAYCKSKVHDTDLINCVKYVHSTNKYIPVRKRLHYDIGLCKLYNKYIVDDTKYDSSYYNIIKYYHQEYLDFKPAFDKILNIYDRAIKTNRYDILKYLNIPINDNFIIVCDTNTIMYENYIKIGSYDLDKSILFNGINDSYYKNMSDEWCSKLPREKVIERYNKVITERFQTGSFRCEFKSNEII